MHQHLQSRVLPVSTCYRVLRSFCEETIGQKGAGADCLAVDLDWHAGQLQQFKQALVALHHLTCSDP